MRKKIIATVVAVVLTLSAVFCAWTLFYWRPWDEYLKDEPMEHPDGVIETKDGKTYGWGEDCDVYMPEHVTTGKIYAPEDHLDEWALGKIYINNTLIDREKLVKQLGELGWKETNEPDLDNAHSFTNDSGIDIVVTTNEHGDVCGIETSGKPVNFLSNDDINTRRQFKMKLGEPVVYVRDNAESITYIYNDLRHHYELHLQFSNNTGELISSKYIWAKVLRAEYDEDGNMVETEVYKDPDEVVIDYYDSNPYVGESWEDFEKRTGIKAEDYIKRVDKEKSDMESIIGSESSETVDEQQNDSNEKEEGE